ncbi:MAG: rhodanese-like domain-containing protein, partial [Gammaproteobacteria bacterium]
AAQIIEHLTDPNWVIWDARSADEYAGIRHTAQRNGHIPGAKHYEWTRAMDRDQHLRLRPLDTIQAELAALGITPDKTIVTHCHSNHRSGFTRVLGKILNFNAMLAYPGSWSEWGNAAETPISTDV